MVAHGGPRWSMVIHVGSWWPWMVHGERLHDDKRYIHHIRIRYDASIGVGIDTWAGSHDSTLSSEPHRRRLNLKRGRQVRPELQDSRAPLPPTRATPAPTRAILQHHCHGGWLSWFREGPTQMAQQLNLEPEITPKA